VGFSLIELGGRRYTYEIPTKTLLDRSEMEGIVAVKVNHNAAE
jgi:hypothetical protein